MARFGPTAYGEAFADVYDDWYEQVSDVDATVGAVTALAGSSPVLELGVGTGRLALPLAATGTETWGLDASLPMLRHLRAKEGADRVRLVLGDMAAPPLRGHRHFRVVFCAYNTFFNLASAAAQRDCLAWAATALAPGGRLAIEAFVPRRDAVAAGRLTVRSIEPDRLVLSRVDLDGDRQVVTGQFVELDGGGRTRLRPYRIRYLFPEQLDELAAEVGLHRTERWSSWDGAPFDESSAEHVSLYAGA